MKKTARRTKPRRRFTLCVEGQEMLVDYTPNWMKGEFATGHFEFRSPHKPARRIPVSTTGYRSHFAPMDEIEAEASPQDYARQYALGCLRSSSPCRRAEEAQPSLFSLLD